MQKYNMYPVYVGNVELIQKGEYLLKKWEEAGDVTKLAKQKYILPKAGDLVHQHYIRVSMKMFVLYMSDRNTEGI